MLPITPCPAVVVGSPCMFTGAFILIMPPVALNILSLMKLMLPALSLLTCTSEPPLEILDFTYVATAFCVGTILLLLAVKVPSVLNSLITAPVPPNTTPPSASSSSPLRSKKLALIEIVPVDCSTSNSSPTLKLPS